jgi:short subunit dehydrogenase-like uncharacterized protein
MIASRRIGLLGATGYTGRLVADELAARGWPHRLGARNPQRLGALKQGGEAEPFVVDAGDRGRLDAFYDGLDAVISCVGPFAQLGMPVVEAAADAGVPYVDSTGELTFMSDVYDRFAAARSPVVPACGFDYLPGDLAAAVAASRLGVRAREIVVAYEIHHIRPSRGTARSAVGIISSVTTVPRKLRVDAPEGSLSAIEVPWGEQLTVPRHLPLARVKTAAVVRRPVATVLGAVAPAGPLLRPVLGLAQPLLTRLAERLPEGPPEDVRRRSHFRLLVEARGDDGARSRVMVEGSDIYRLTAVLLVEAALRVEGAGAMAPAQALEPEGFLNAVSGELLSWSVLD